MIAGQGVPREWLVLLFAGVIFLGCVISPPSLMDDVDAAHAQIARTMLESGDFVTARLDGVKYMEKAPLHFWMIAASYSIFGVHDWAARIPLALCVVALCWVTTRFGTWAFSAEAGFYAGLALATCAGMFLFTRVLIPDAILGLAVTVALWSFLRVLETDEPHPAFWSVILAVSAGIGLLVKGLLAVILIGGGSFFYLVVTRQLSSRWTWRRLRPFQTTLIILMISAPWHIVATLQNPPLIDFTMRSEPGKYRGFFWFFFINEHVLRFLNLRYPRDYDTVPRVYFWVFHLIWLFPWSVFLPAALRLGYKPGDRAGRTRLLALCWAGALLTFFSFSTTQEYYSVPCYPALALILGSAMAAGGRLVRIGINVAGGVAIAAAMVVAIILSAARSFSATRDITTALTLNPEAYTLSLGHIQDLTLRAFAYLRVPLLVAGIALLLGAVGAWRCAAQHAILALALMMAIFAHAARLALVKFDPYLSSRPLAEALLRAPAGELIADDEYYAFSSVFFYTNRRGLLLNGRRNNVEYGSYAPGAPAIFLDDAEWARRWSSPNRYYLLIAASSVPRLERVIGRPALHVVMESGGKYLFTNK